MRVVALISGGKDSTFNMMSCQSEGHEIVALANLYPATTEDELDSFMFQTVGHMGIDLYAQAMDLPLYRMQTKGKSKQTTKSYAPTSDEDEVEDLYRLLKNIKEHVKFDAVAVGAILSDYQRIRCENVCSRLQLTCIAYLWQRDQVELLQEMVDSNLHAIFVKVACLGLTCKSYLGKRIKDMKDHLMEIKDKYGVNVCGEGGEYETFTLDCPLFKKKICIDESEIIITNSDPVCPVGHLNFKKLHLEEKSSGELKVKTSLDFVEDCLEFDDQKLDEMIRVTNESQQQPRLFKGKCVSNDKGWYWISAIEGVGETMKEGTIHALNQLEEVISQNSLSIENSIYVTLYISKMSSYLELNQLYNEKFNFQNPPPRVCVETCLPKSCQVMIEVLLFKQNPQNLKSINNLHVQGISHWAPANIGPYSQSKSIGAITFISGQIGLIPGSLTIIKGGIRNENQLTLRHISRVAKIMNCKNILRDIVHGTCFVTHPEHIEVAKFQFEKSTDKALSNFVVVSGLPRGALVEWQVFCDNEINDFEYDEWNYEIKDSNMLMKTRWNSNYYAASWQVSQKNQLKNDFDKVSIKEAFKFILEKLNPRATQMKVFFKVLENSKSNIFEEVFEEVYEEQNLKLSTSFVPSYFVENEKTILSISFLGF